MGTEEAYRLAASLLARGLADQAYQVAGKNQRLFPRDVRHLILLGEITFRLGVHEDALRYFNQAMAASAPTPDLLVARARCSIALNREDQAIEDIGAAIRRDPYHSGARALAAKLILNHGRSVAHRPDRGWALVTGAARGIGRATVERLAIVGFSWIALDRDGSELHLFIGGKSWAGVAVRPVVADIADRQAVRDALAGFASIDIVVNNAAIYSEAPLTSIGEAELHDLIGINLMGAIIITQEALPKMRPGGRIIVVGSIGAGSAHGTRNIAHYLASKGALAGFWGASIAELADREIVTHMVKPGLIDTPMQRSRGASRLADVPPERAMTPASAVADAVAALALPQDGLSFVSGLVAEVP